MAVDRRDEVMDRGRAEVDDRPDPAIGPRRRHASATRQLGGFERRVDGRRLLAAGFPGVAGFLAAGFLAAGFLVAGFFGTAARAGASLGSVPFVDEAPDDDSAAADPAVADAAGAAGAPERLERRRAGAGFAPLPVRRFGPAGARSRGRPRPGAT